MDKLAQQEYAKANIERLGQRMTAKLKLKESRLVERFNKSKQNSLNKLSSLYEVMAEIYSYVDTFTPCKKGCAKCCYYSVSISELEIQYIELKKGIKRNKKE